MMVGFGIIIGYNGDILTAFYSPSDGESDFESGGVGIISIQPVSKPLNRYCFADVILCSYNNNTVTTT